MALEAEVARPIYAARPSTGTCFGWNMLPFRPEAGQADEQLGRQLWAGVPGVDYTEATRWKTPLNSG